MRAVARTHIGYLRQRNEDSHLVMDARESILALVSDGMGGPPGGDVASALVSDVFAANMDQILTTPHDDLEQRLRGLVSAAHDRLALTGQARPELEGMGATLTAVFLTEGGLWFCHCGDSRLYLLRRHVLQRLTTDHNPPGMPHALSKVVGGMNSFSGADTGFVELEDKDRLLLCTDGLSDIVSDRDIARVLGNGEKAEQQAQGLVACALEEGGKDNVTALVIDPFG